MEINYWALDRNNIIVDYDDETISIPFEKLERYAKSEGFFNFEWSSINNSQDDMDVKTWKCPSLDWYLEIAGYDNVEKLLKEYIETMLSKTL